MKPELINTYTENGVVIKVYAEKQVKRVPWQKNDTFYAAKMRVEDDNGLFTTFSRKPGKA